VTHFSVHDSSSDFPAEAVDIEHDSVDADDSYDVDVDAADVDMADAQFGDDLPSDSDVDAELDAAIDAVNDGGESVRPVATAQSLPLAMSTRDAFIHAREIPATGDARVDAATARLSELVDLPTSDHAAVYDDVHRRLQDALADADQR
jgi:hypothetical protein